MRKNRLFCLWICLCLLLSCVTPVCSAAEQQETRIDESVTNGSHTLDGKRPVLGDRQAITNAQSVILYELNTQTLMYAWNADARVYPSSLVKIMTAMIAVEKANMSDIVTVKQSVLDTVDFYAVNAGLKADERMSVENLLYCMMVGSANDAAAVIADYIGGSEAVFVESMNQKAAELGCTDTNFVNAHGLHHENQYSTARDLSKILEAAMQNEKFCTFFGAANYDVPATNVSEERNLKSSNYLINSDTYATYIDTRVTGGRTGRAEDGTRCLAASAQKSGLHYISIVLGSKSQYEDDGKTERIHGSFNETKAMFDLGFDNLKPAQILYPNQALTQLPAGENGLVLTAGPNVSAATVLPEDVTSSGLRYVYSTRTEDIANAKKGSPVGTVSVMHNDICVAYAELFALHDLKLAPQPWTGGNGSAMDAGSNSWMIVAICVVLIAVISAGVIIVVHTRRRKKRNFARRSRYQYRRNR